MLKVPVMLAITIPRGEDSRRILSGSSAGIWSGISGKTGGGHAHLYAGQPIGFRRIQPRFKRPGGEGGGEQDANLWRDRIYGLYPVSARRGANRKHPGQVEEITSASPGAISRHEAKPSYRPLARAILH